MILGSSKTPPAARRTYRSASADPDQADPRPLHVPAVEHADAAPEPVARPCARRAGEAVEPAADQVADRVAAEREQRQQDRVGEQHQRADADPERAVEEERAHGVVPEEPEHDRGEEQEVAVGVHEHVRERRLAAVAPPARRRHGAGGRSHEERPVVRLPVVVTRRPERQRHPDDEEGRRERDVEPPARQVRRVERRQVVRAALGVAVVVAQHRDDERVDAEGRQPEARNERRQPPAVLPRRVECPPRGLRRHVGQNLQRSGETGFEPATARPPAGAIWLRGAVSGGVERLRVGRSCPQWRSLCTPDCTPSTGSRSSSTNRR